MGPLDEQAARLEAAAGAILDFRSRVEARAPWPLAELYGTEAEASWGPHELLAHLQEMLPYWLGEVERILDAAPGTTVRFGRTAEDTVRIGVIGRDRTIPARELFDRLEADASRVARRMRALSDADAARVGTHPRLGEVSVAGLFERFVTGHIEGHVDQLREILESQGA